MAETKEYDVVVIGAGPGGYVGAIRASQLGLSACVVEKEKPGGVCLNIGCIPSKALIHQARIYSDREALEAMGVTVDTSGLDYSVVFKKSRAAADRLSRGVGSLLKKNNVDVVSGTAEITGADEVGVNGERTIRGKNILIATGSRPVELPDFPFDEETILSSNGALMLEELPESIVILGGGYIGCEFAYVMNAFGVDVTIVEMLDHLLPMEDEDAATQLTRAFKKRGIAMHTSTKALSMNKKSGSVEVEIQPEDGETSTLSAEKLLVVVGRRPNTQNIGLERIGIETDRRGFVPVGDYYQTETGSVYAVGDVVNSPLLAHVAFKEAEIAAEHMAGKAKETRVDPNTVPAAVYTEPQVAGFGVNERTAREQGIKYETATFPYRGAGKSVAIEQPDGFVKLLLAPDTHEILGAGIVGAEATELIHEILLAKKAELLPEDIATMIHAHPTLSEAVMEAHRAAEGWAIHV